MSCYRGDDEGGTFLKLSDGAEAILEVPAFERELTTGIYIPTTHENHERCDMGGHFGFKRVSDLTGGMSVRNNSFVGILEGCPTWELRSEFGPPFLLFFFFKSILEMFLL